MARSTISSIHQFVKGDKDQPFTLGIDVHKRSYHIALRRADGKAVTLVCPADPEGLVGLIQRLSLSVTAVAYEAGPTGFGLARALRAAGIETLMAAPSRIPRAITSGAKTDRLDCLRLADYAARGLIRSIAVPTPQQEAQRSLQRRRHDIVDSLRRCKQRIKGFLLFLGLAEPKETERWRRDASEALRKLPVDPHARLTLESHLRELTFYQNELSKVEEQVRQMVREQGNTVANLRSVPGVGEVVATTFVLELFCPERFQRAEEVTSYLGLAPMVRHSGEKTPSGRLRPVGQTRLRSLLVEAAWMWRSYDPYARDLYNRLLGRMGIAQKAITAVARKLAVILWRLYIERRYYRPAVA
jgi:transposase